MEGDRFAAFRCGSSEINRERVACPAVTMGYLSTLTLRFTAIRRPFGPIGQLFGDRRHADCSAISRILDAQLRFKQKFRPFGSFLPR